MTESSVIGATGGVVGVTLNGLAAPPVGANTTINFGAKSFAPGNLGTWNLVFGPSAAGFGINRFDFAYNETESSGFDVAFYGLDGISVLDIILVRPAGNASTQCGLPSTCSLVAYTNLTGIGRVSITDLGNTAHPLGDNLHIDNITVDTRPAGEDLGELPEPGTWLMVGTGAAAALFGHRFAKKAAA